MTYSWWLAPAVILGLQIVQLEAGLGRARSRGTKLVFSGSIWLKLMFGGAAGATAVLLAQQSQTTEWWIDALAVAFIIGFLVAWPKTIVTDERGIECRWWWRRRVFIPWDQVEYAENGKAGAIEIVGAYARITFEGYNADPARFRKEVTTRSNVKKIETPSKFTGLHL